MTSVLLYSAVQMQAAARLGPFSRKENITSAFLFQSYETEKLRNICYLTRIQLGINPHSAT
jgi:hypothetical protein